MFPRVSNHEGRGQWCWILVFTATTIETNLLQEMTQNIQKQEIFYVEVLMWEIHGTDCDK